MEIAFTKKNKNNVCDAIKGKKSWKKLTPEEWHQFVQNYNYEDGNEPFEWLIRQKACDKGTALCLYWYLQPDFYCDPRNAGRGSYDLAKEIEDRFVNGFYETELFSFDPQTEFLTSGTNVSCIPKAMQQKTKGIPFDRVGVEYAFLRRPNEKELDAIVKKVGDAVSIIRKTNPLFENRDADEAIIAIRKSVEYWKGKNPGKIRIRNLSYLWLDSLCRKYGWIWIVWDFETGKSIGASNPSRSLTCLSDTLIKHTLDGFQPTKMISELFDDLNGADDICEMKEEPYSGIGLLFSTTHLKFQEPCVPGTIGNDKPEGV